MSKLNLNTVASQSLQNREVIPTEARKVNSKAMEVSIPSKQGSHSYKVMGNFGDVAVESQSLQNREVIPT